MEESLDMLDAYVPEAIYYLCCPGCHGFCQITLNHIPSIHSSTSIFSCSLNFDVNRPLTFSKVDNIMSMTLYSAFTTNSTTLLVNCIWCEWWQCITKLSGNKYDWPKGPCGHSYNNPLGKEIRHLSWGNYMLMSKRLIVLSAVVLQRDKLSELILIFEVCSTT